VVETGIASYSDSVGVAEIIAGDAVVSRERYEGEVDVGLGEYGPPTL
jgi:hypothetical protein